MHSSLIIGDPTFYNHDANNSVSVHPADSGDECFMAACAYYAYLSFMSAAVGTASVVTCYLEIESWLIHTWFHFVHMSSTHKPEEAFRL